MPGKRRPIEDFPTPTLTQFEALLQKASEKIYVRMPHLAMRDAALLAFEFLYKCRVSEAVGRTYSPSGNPDQADVYVGVTIKDFKVTKVKNVKVLRVKFRILKRGRAKKHCPECHEVNHQKANFCIICGNPIKDLPLNAKLPQIWEWSSIPLKQKLVHYILKWLDYLLKHGATDNTKVFDITRNRAWQIMRDLGIMNHTQRHWRATQLADTMDAFELKEALHRATIPFEYVHRAESRRLDKEKKADEIWK